MAKQVAAMGPAERERLRSYRVWDPRQITCPMLCLAGAGELPDWLDQTRECYELLPNPQKALVITSAEDGAEGHCHLDNLGLMSEIVFDWLDEVFGA